ncbi:hypothetical protein MOUN0_L00320 [Monosporozyma unispora]|nr:hypothetical protein C6P44_003023 [Kazachstania unispora]
MKFSNYLVVLVTTTVVLGRQSVFNFNDWSRNDLVAFLQDNVPLPTENTYYKSEDLTSKSIDDLKKDAEKYWQENAKRVEKAKKQWWKFWAWGKNKYYATEFLPKSSDSGASSSVADWLFGTWSKDSLTEFLKENGISVKDETTSSKDQLLATIRDNFKKISKKLDNSGVYPSRDYFKGWSSDDLTLWLDKFKVSYDDKLRDNKDELLNLVRKNIYQMSHFLENERLSLFSQLKLLDKQLYDKAGNLKEDVFDSWNTSDLEKWLQSHEIPIQDNLIKSHGYLVRLAEEHRNLLNDDINWYLSMAKRKSSPFLEKTPEYVASMWDVSKEYLGNLYEKGKDKSNEIMNDTFLVGIDNWSKDRLKNFLDVRDIKYSFFATRQELIDLAVSNRNKPLRKLKKQFKQSVEALNDAKDWTLEKRDDFMESETYDKLLENLEVMNEQRKDWQKSMKDSLDSWSADDLKKYINQFGIKLDENTYSKEELIEIAKQNTQWFLGGQKNEPFYKRGYIKATNMLKRLKNYILYR